MVRIYIRLASKLSESIKETVIYNVREGTGCIELFKSPFVTCVCVHAIEGAHKIDFPNSWLYSFGVTFQSAGQPLGYPSGNYYEQ